MELSPDSQKVMAKTVKQFQETGGIWLATEHLLLGFLKSRDRFSRRVVQSKMSHKAVLTRLSQMMELGPPNRTVPERKTERLQEALTFAERRAMESGSEIEPVHLFLGLLAASSGETKAGMAQHLILDFEIDPRDWAREAEKTISAR